MQLTAAIVDDVREDRARLALDIQRYIDERPEHSVSFSFFESAEDMIHSAASVQIAFLDICMAGMNGIELARRLRAYDEKMLIVFLSTSREYAFDAFPVHPFDYLVKPYAPEALTHVLDEALRVLAAADPGIDVRVARAVHHIPLRRIISAVARGHNVELHLLGEEPIRTLMNFSEIEAALSADPRFLLCNRGVLINMDHALSLSKDMLRMQDGTAFALRSRGKAALAARFTQYQLSRLKGGRP